MLNPSVPHCVESSLITHACHLAAAAAPPRPAAPLPTPGTQVGAKYTPLFPYFTDKVAHPGDAFKVVSDTYVTDDSGTGVVHQAPAFGEDDYRWVCEEVGLSEGVEGVGSRKRGMFQGGMGDCDRVVMGIRVWCTRLLLVLRMNTGVMEGACPGMLGGGQCVV
jgi:hypothetical protein